MDTHRNSRNARSRVRSFGPAKQILARSWPPVLALALFAGAAPDARAQSLGIPVNARRNELETFSEAQVDQALQRASDAVSTNNGAGDVACGTFFFRWGPTRTFSGPNEINTLEDLLEAAEQTQTVKVVNDVNFCDDRTNTNFVGCTVNRSIVLEDVSDSGEDPAVDGALWAHEFGHAVGLDHRGDDGLAIMAPIISPANSHLSLPECHNFLNADSANFPMDTNPQFSPEPPGSAAAEAAPATQQLAAVPIEEFVKSIYVDALPVDAMLRYGAADVPVLVQMLSDRSKAKTWPMVTSVLGMIGDDTTASRLIEFIETERNGQLSRGEFNGVRSAIQSLGFLASRVQSGVALDYLMKANDPEFWTNQQSMRWTSRATPTLEDRDRALAKVVTMSLGLSGDPRARTMLQTRWDETIRESADGQEQKEMLGLLEQAMTDNAKIARIGLIDYYRP